MRPKLPPATVPGGRSVGRAVGRSRIKSVRRRVSRCADAGLIRIALRKSSGANIGTDLLTKEVHEPRFPAAIKKSCKPLLVDAGADDDAHLRRLLDVLRDAGRALDQ